MRPHFTENNGAMLFHPHERKYLYECKSLTAPIRRNIGACHYCFNGPADGMRQKAPRMRGQ